MIVRIGQANLSLNRPRVPAPDAPALVRPPPMLQLLARIRAAPCTTSAPSATTRPPSISTCSGGASRPSRRELLALDDARKAAVSAAQGNQERRNALAKEIGAAKKAKDEARAQGLMEEVARLKAEAPELEAEQAEAGRILDERLAAIPNLPEPPTCPRARTSTAMSRYRRWGDPSPARHGPPGPRRRWARPWA